MEKLKKVIEQYGRWNVYSMYIERIEAQLDLDFSICIENAKSLIEGIAKQICSEKNVEVKKDESFNKLIKIAFDAIGHQPGEYINVISGSLSAIAQQLGNLRTKIGATAHGKTIDGLSMRNEIINSISKEFLIDTVDIITCFLIRNFENENPRNTPIEYKKEIKLIDYEDFNNYWDENYGEFTMGDYSYQASEILYNVDYPAYETECNAFINKEVDKNNE